MTRLRHWLTGLLVGLLLSGGIFAATNGGHHLFITDDGLVDYNANSAATAFRVCGDANEENCPINAYVHPSKGPVNEPICSSGPCDPLLEIPSGKTFTIAQIDGDDGIKVAYSEIGAFDMLERLTNPAAQPSVNGRWKLFFKSGGLYYQDDAATPNVTPLSTRAGHRTKSITVLDPTASETNQVQFMWPGAVTITRVECSTDTGSITVNLDERVLTTPNTAGTNTLSAGLVCDTGNQSSCASGCDVNTISDTTIAGGVPHNVQLSSPSGTPGVVRIHVTATLQ